MLTYDKICAYWLEQLNANMKGTPLFGTKLDDVLQICKRYTPVRELYPSHIYAECPLLGDAGTDVIIGYPVQGYQRHSLKTEFQEVDELFYDFTNIFGTKSRSNGVFFGNGSS